MRIVIQRVNKASVLVESKCVGSIGKGLLLFVGFGQLDSEASLQPLIDKILSLRIFPGEKENSSFDTSVMQINGGILAVSQFTLYADCRGGRRPGFSNALDPGRAILLYEKFCSLLRKSYPEGQISEGIFGADMKVSLENDGPVTLILGD